MIIWWVAKGARTTRTKGARTARFICPGKNYTIIHVNGNIVSYNFIKGFTHVKETKDHSWT